MMAVTIQVDELSNIFEMSKTEKGRHLLRADSRIQSVCEYLKHYFSSDDYVKSKYDTIKLLRILRNISADVQLRSVIRKGGVIIEIMRWCNESKLHKRENSLNDFLASLWQSIFQVLANYCAGSEEFSSEFWAVMLERNTLQKLFDLCFTIGNKNCLAPLTATILYCICENSVESQARLASLFEGW